MHQRGTPAAKDTHTHTQHVYHHRDYVSSRSDNERTSSDRAHVLDFTRRGGRLCVTLHVIERHMADIRNSDRSVCVCVSSVRVFFCERHCSGAGGRVCIFILCPKEKIVTMN